MAKAANKNKKATPAAPPLTPEQLAAKEEAKAKASARAKAARAKKNAVKELREKAKDTAAVAVVTDNTELLAEAKAMFAKADEMEAALGQRAPAWFETPGGLLNRAVALENAAINATISVPDDNGWVHGQAALSQGDQLIMSASGFVADSSEARDILKTRLGIMIVSLRAVAKKTL